MPVSTLPVVPFDSAKKWETWLKKHHGDEQGLWVQLYKKDSGKPSMTYAEALEVALCYGWIDGQKKAHDAESWLQKFTPRRPKSIWSKRNTEHAERLMREGKMKSSGLKEVEAAKADGRWQKAYDSPANMAIPPDFLKELAKRKKAKAFFETLNKANTYAIAWRLQSAKKPETREKRMRAILEMLEKGEKLH